MALYYCVGFLIIFFLCLVAEFLLPSAGLIGAAAFVSAIIAVVSAFSYSSLAGMIVSGIILVSTPLVLYFMVRLWPHTPIGRRILNRQPGEQFDHDTVTLADGTPIMELIGCVGVALTDLLPNGRVLIDQRKLDAVSIGMPIDTGTKVVVTRIVARKIQVRIAEENQSNDNVSSRQGSSTEPSSELESFDLESLD